MTQVDLDDPILTDENCGYKDRYVAWRWNPKRWKWGYLVEKPQVTALVINHWRHRWLGPLLITYRRCEPNPETYSKKQLKLRDQLYPRT